MKHTPSDPSQAKLKKHYKKTAFNRTMTQVYTYTSPAQQRFSKLLHLRAVEQVTDFIGSTIARPVPLIFGSLGVIVMVGSMYIIAKQYGYTLSGSEPLFAFGFGWALGMVVDYARLLVRGKRSHR